MGFSPPSIGRLTSFCLPPGVRSVMHMNSLIRPRNGRVLAGVCAGIADRFGWSRMFVRVAWVVLSFFPGPLWIAYVVLWFLMPSEGNRR
ncbi:phage shock protein C (PspC) family protein [Curtobacterium sp. PhB130]|nr:phage shock protein C (PspC) family protein [Curtobacterium sp. PhB130]